MELQYEDDIRELLERYVELFNFYSSVLSCDYGIVDVFIYNYQVIILN